jgi:cyclopropane-fatty-acyl-phospholipid synthase
MWNRLLDQFLDRLINSGSLEVGFPDGTTGRYGDGTGPLYRVTISDPTLPRRLCLQPDLAFGEGYMDGTLRIDGDDLRGLMAMVLSNAGTHPKVWWRKPIEGAMKAARRLQMWNPAHRSRQNVAHHYDLSSELYELFLDKDRQYSCAYFRDPGNTLEQAQIDKKAHIAGKLLLKPGMRVLDIGCGWGGLAITLVRDYGARVLGVTLSEEQHRIATERVRAAGLEDRVEIRLTDYRKVQGRFDRIVSVGMFEHVGVPHYREYFAKVRDLLEDDGVALIHTIGRAEPPSYTGGFIRKYIFPGGYCPAMSEVMTAIEREGLWPDDVEVWRLHYAETLRHWHDRFMANADRVRALYDERFVRMWSFYLIASEMTFRAARQCVFQFQLSRDQRAVPLTRDYLYADGVKTGTDARPKPRSVAAR